MGWRIEPTIVDGNIEKKSLYGSEDEYDEEKENSKEIRKTIEELESLETDSYSALGNVGEIETLFDANALGRATINVQTTQKQAAQAVEPQLSTEKIAEIGDDADKLEEEFGARRDAELDELDNFF